MGNIAISMDYSSDVTVVSNIFIDNYMTEANDAQIKVYLYLLRYINTGTDISVEDIADHFNYTEKDVLRALKYWDIKRVISLSFNSMGSLTGIRLLDIRSGMPASVYKAEDFRVSGPDMYDRTGGMQLKSPAVQVNDTDPGYCDQDEGTGIPGDGGRVKVIDFSNKSSYTAEELMQFKSRPEISQLLFIAETYLAKTLRPDEISSILFMYDKYGFEPDLIEYLIEYCANNKKKNIKYIESVAKTWVETGITSVDEAKARTGNAPKEVYEVFRAFGISGRNPIEPEISYVCKWSRVYGFGIDIICEACNRTIMSIHSASFEYADSILSNWKEAGVKELKDIDKLDAAHSMKKSKKASKPASSGRTGGASSQTSDFNNFSQRKYDYAELEKDALTN